ncbi:type I methionyl aminopeptidase, partial [bacterium (Candidatus Gribaldobacteria) CG_4_9_14_3_um_filter_36_15]
MITIKSEKEIEIMREGGKMLAGIMEELRKKVQPGITTKELDRVAETLIFKSGAEPAFKGYENFPATLCTSLNQVVVHGVPSNYKLKSGDILSLDLGIKYKGFFSDMAITIAVGKIDSETNKLIKVTERSLREGIKAIRPGNHIGDISFAIQKYVESRGFKVVRELCGHGIGRELHEDPQILNYGKKHTGPEIKEGMVFCLEPMV